MAIQRVDEASATGQTAAQISAARLKAEAEAKAAAANNVGANVFNSVANWLNQTPTQSSTPVQTKVVAPTTTKPTTTTARPVVVKTPGSGDQIATVPKSTAPKPTVVAGPPPPPPAIGKVSGLLPTTPTKPISTTPSTGAPKSTAPKSTAPKTTTPGTTGGTAGGTTDGTTPGTGLPTAPVVDNSQSVQMLNDLMEQQKQLTNPYMDALTQQTFEYDIEADPDYRAAVAQAEQQVADMMGSRGMLFSSLTSSAFQSRVFELQSQFRSQAWDKYTADRQFNQQMAQMTYDQQNNDFSKNMQLINMQIQKEDTAWNQSFQLAQFDLARQKEVFDQEMAIANYNASREDAAWQKSYQQQQLSISRANASYQRQQAQAAAKLAEARATIETNVALVQTQQDGLSRTKEAWSTSSKGASQAVSDYYAGLGINVPVGTSYSSSQGVNAVSAAEKAVKQAVDYVKNQAVEYRQADVVQASINGFMGAPAADNSNAVFYDNYLTDISYIHTATEAKSYASDLRSNKTEYLKYVTPTQYNTLVREANSKVDTFNKQSETFVG